MKEYDYVELNVEKEEYAKDGAHKGMCGTIVWPESKSGTWLVEFHSIRPWYDEEGLHHVGIISVKEEDLILIRESPE